MVGPHCVFPSQFYLLAGPLVELELAVFTVFIRVFAGASAGYRILYKQTLSPLWALITTRLTNTGQTERWGGRRRGRLSQCTVIALKKGRPQVNPSSLLLQATDNFCMWQLSSIPYRVPQSRQKVKQEKLPPGPIPSLPSWFGLSLMNDMC